MKTNEEFLKELIVNLSKPIDFQWRVQSFSKNKPVATAVAYIDARDVIDLLNQYAVYGWHKEFYEMDGDLFCKIGVVMPDGSIQWRSDCGVESQSDGKKGRASDASKRSAVNWGIGRFLYDQKIQYVTANEVKTNSNSPYCIDEQGKQIWDLTKFINDKLKAGSKPSQQKPVETPKQPLQPSQEFNKPDTSKVEKAFEKWNYLQDVLPALKTIRDLKNEWKSVTLCADIKTFATEVPKELQLEIHSHLTTKK